MYKFFSCISFGLFTLVSFGMENSYSRQNTKKNEDQSRIVTYKGATHKNTNNTIINNQKAMRINTGKYKYAISQNSFSSSAITKPNRKHQESDKTAQVSKFIYDAYTQRRGVPKMLEIFCDDCNNSVMHYQKDGPGPLLRCYLDRIHHPENLMNRQHCKFNKKTSPKLECESCNIVIGVPIIYEKENRPAYHMRPGFFSIKKI